MTSPTLSSALALPLAQAAPRPAAKTQASTQHAEYLMAPPFYQAIAIAISHLIWKEIMDRLPDRSVDEATTSLCSQ
jgi:hypothetical protein